MIPIINNGYRKRTNSPPSPSSIRFVQGHMEDSFKDLMRTYELKDLYWINDEPNNIRAIGVLTHPKGGLKDNLILLFPPYRPMAGVMAVDQASGVTCSVTLFDAVKKD